MPGSKVGFPALLSILVCLVCFSVLVGNGAVKTAEASQSSKKSCVVAVPTRAAIRSVPLGLPYGTPVYAVVDLLFDNDVSVCTIRSGTTGTIYCYDPSDFDYPYLVNWDNGCGYYACEVCDVCAPSGIWMTSTQIGLINDDSSAAYRYFVPYFTGLSGTWSGIGVTNEGLEAASVVVTVYGVFGTLRSTDFLTLPANGGQGSAAIGQHLTVEGWMEVASDQPLTGLCFFGTSAMLSYMADAPFDDNLYTSQRVPHVACDYSWSTHIMICNPNSASTNVTVTFVDGFGDADSARNYYLDAMGSVRISLTDLLVGKTTVNGGSVLITSTVGVATFGLYSNVKSGGYCYAAVNAQPTNSSDDGTHPF